MQPATSGRGSDPSLLGPLTHKELIGRVVGAPQLSSWRTMEKEDETAEEGGDNDDTHTRCVASPSGSLSSCSSSSKHYSSSSSRVSVSTPTAQARAYDDEPP